MPAIALDPPTAESASRNFSTWISVVQRPNSKTACVQRTASGGWSADWLDPTADLAIPSFNLSIPRSEIFARD